MTALDLELAWAAGFYDGEGCTSLCRDHKYPGSSSIRMEVAQVELQPLARFHKAVGGKGRIRKREQRGARSSCYVWEAKSRAALEVGQLLLPYLSDPKKEQLKAKIIEKYTLKTEHGYEQTQAREMVIAWQAL